MRSLSTKPSPPRPGASSEFTPKNRGDVCASESLIEDEAGLIDLVCELRTDSFPGQLTSEDKDLDADGARKRVRRRNRERNRGSVKRKRVTEFDNFPESNKRGTRDGDEGKDANGDEDEESNSGRKPGGVERERKNEDSCKGKRNERGLNSRKRRKGKKNNLIRKSNFEDDDANDIEEESGRKMGGIANTLIEENNNISDAANDDDNDEVFRKNASSTLGLEKDVSQTGSPRNSPGKLEKRGTRDSDEGKDANGDEDEESNLGRKPGGIERERENEDSRKGKRNERGLNSRKRRKGKKNNLIRKSNFEDDAAANDIEEESGRKMGGIANILIEENNNISDAANDDDNDEVFRKNASSTLGLEKDVSETGSPRNSPGKLEKRGTQDSDEGKDANGNEDEESNLGRKPGGIERERENEDSCKGKRNERGLNSRKRRKGKKNNLIRKSNFEDDDAANDIEEESGRKMGGIANILIEENNNISDAANDDDNDEVFRKNASSTLGLEKDVSQTGSPRNSPGKSESYLSETRFDQLSLSPLSLKGIKDAGYEKMTMVQEATLPAILEGKDVLAKARTGTGKTVAFLLPSIEIVSKLPPTDRNVMRPEIHVLVICPTRELANQTASEANTLLKYHPSIGVQVVIGGKGLALEQKNLRAKPCQILVATPGRLRDHIRNTAGFATRLTGVKVLVLDEADRLLAMGFRIEIEKIIAAIPKQRQTLFFSATIPKEVHQVCHIALRRDHEFINAVQEGTETHSLVRQMHMVAPLDKQFSLLYVLLKEHITDDVDYKVIVFCTTAMLTKLVAEILGELKLNVREIHSRKSQNYRTRVSDEFRKSKGLILVTSDVSARGVDYPDVTLVIQVGVPADRDQYIHRLGRTGRKGKEGQGILLLAPWEEFFVSTINDFPITKPPLPSVDPDTEKEVERAVFNSAKKSRESAYRAWLGYYNSIKKLGKDKCRLVELANEFSRSMGLEEPPAIPKLTLYKLGLRYTPGVRAK